MCSFGFLFKKNLNVSYAYMSLFLVANQSLTMEKRLFATSVLDPLQTQHLVFVLFSEKYNAERL